jgi:hypothetical protein
MTPAQTYALVFGATLLLVGIIGFAVNSSFDTGSDISTGDKLIVFEVSGWHNLVHIASGLLGLALFRTPAGGRAYALGFGAVYLIVTIIGFADGNDVIGLIPVNAADNVLHLAIAALGLAAGLASSDDRNRAVTT